jgi:hypothetical protein
MKAFARNKVELAKALGISRKGLQRFYELPNHHPEPKADGRLNIKEWASFISANAQRITTGTATIPLSKKDNTRISLMELQIQREAVKLDRERGDLLKEIGGIIGGDLERLRTLQARLLRFELPPLLEMRPARQIEKIILDKWRNAWNEFFLSCQKRYRGTVEV